MNPHDARYVALAFALVLLATVWGCWPHRHEFVNRLDRLACRRRGHSWRFIERADVHERWAICDACGERRRGW